VSTPRLAKEYPLILITGERQIEYHHSQMHNIPRLRKRASEPRAQVHPGTATELGLREGEMVAVETPKGSIRMRLVTSKDMSPGVVSIPHGWSQANANVLTDDSLCDPIMGEPELNAILCRPRKV